MPDEKKLTAGEALGVAGETLKEIGEALDDPNTPNRITLTEWMEIIKTAATHAWNEYND